MTRRLVLLVLVCLVAAGSMLLAPAVTRAAPPSNDDFDAAVSIGSLPWSTFGSNVDTTEATKAANDPVATCLGPAGYGHSVWYRFTPATSLWIEATTQGSAANHDTVMAVYTGVAGGLNQVACNNDRYINYSYAAVGFAATAGTTYHVMVGTHGTSPGGPMTLDVFSVAPPSNDDFDAATVIDEPGRSFSVDTRAATKASDDPSASCATFLGYGHSVWYRFTPATSMRLQVSGGRTAVVAVYTGGRGALNEVKCSAAFSPSVAFNATAGTSYSFLLGVSGATNPGSEMSLLVTQLPDDTTPPTIYSVSVMESAATAHAIDSTLFYRPDGGGTFEVRASARDDESGIASYAFPEVFGGDATTRGPTGFFATYSWTAGASASGPRTVRVTDESGNEASDEFIVAPDAAAPTVAMGTPAAGATVTNPQPIEVTAADPAGGAGMAGVSVRYCLGTSCAFASGTSIGAATTTGNGTYAVSWTNQPADGTYTLVARATDNVGNTADAPPVTVRVGNEPVVVPPPSTPVLVLVEDEPDEHVNGTTLYYSPYSSSGGAFTVEATTSDAESGIRDVAFPVVFGGDAATVTTPDGAGKYVRLYRWQTNAYTAGAKTVTATNGAGKTASSTFTVTEDYRLPTASIAAPSPDAAVANGQTIKIAANDTESGVARVEVKSCPGTACSFGYSGAVSLGVDDAAPYAVTWNNQPANGTYTLVAQATDNVGHAAASAPVTVRVVNETTPPTDLRLNLTETEPDEYADNVNKVLYYDSSGTNTGSFKVVVSARDLESGIAGVTFPAVFGAPEVNDRTAPYARIYTWPAGARDVGNRTVRVRNGAGLTATATFVVRPDIGNPTAAIRAPVAGATVRNGAVIRVEAADALSGVAGVEVRYCQAVSCTFATGMVVGTDATPAAGFYTVTWNNQPPNGRYRLIAQAVDKVGRVKPSLAVSVVVGNAVPAAASATTPAPAAAADSTAPAPADTDAPTVVVTAPTAGSTVTGPMILVARATDKGGSGVADVTFQQRAVGGDWTDLGHDRAAPYRRMVDTSAWATGAHLVRAVATDGAGNRTASAPVRVTVGPPERDAA